MTESVLVSCQKHFFGCYFVLDFCLMRFFSYLIPKPGSGQKPVSGLFSYTEIISSCLQPSLQLTKNLCLLGKSGWTLDFKPRLAQERASEWDRRSLMGHIYSLHSTQQYISVFTKVDDFVWRGAQIISCAMGISTQSLLPEMPMTAMLVIWVSRNYTHSKWEQYPLPVVCS